MKRLKLALQLLLAFFITIVAIAAIPFAIAIAAFAVVFGTVYLIIKAIEAHRNGDL